MNEKKSKSDSIRPEIASLRKDILKSWINKKIVNVRRQVFESDSYLEDFEQMADGSIEITLDDSRIFHFVPLTTEYSVGVGIDKMPVWGDSYKLINPSHNSFWRERTNQAIQAVTVLKASHTTTHRPSEFGIEMVFENEKQLCMEFISDLDVQDTLRIVERCEYPNIVRQKVT